MADRIVVMHKGRIARILERAEFDPETIVSAASGLLPTAVGELA